jgi:hypothetical protein
MNDRGDLTFQVAIGDRAGWNTLLRVSGDRIFDPGNPALVNGQESLISSWLLFP